MPAERLLEFEIPEGKTREQLIRARVGQRAFRDWVLSSYNYACCITGIKQPELLIAAHIKPWSIDEKNRMNPSNGLALNALHDKAFEHGYFTITSDYIIKVSPFIRKQQNTSMDFLINFEGKKITLPSKFLPDPALLKYHNEECFKH